MELKTHDMLGTLDTMVNGILRLVPETQVISISLFIPPERYNALQAEYPNFVEKSMLGESLLFRGGRHGLNLFPLEEEEEVDEENVEADDERL